MSGEGAFFLALCARLEGWGGGEPLSSSHVWCRALMVLSFFIPLTPFLFPLSMPVRSQDAPQVTGLFRTQLEDGIMGMDNCMGAFWLQLREHYERTMGEMEEDDKGEREEEDGPSFDPSRFLLCYDRRPPSADLRSGVGSGALTLGGSDPLLHDTPMVYASNVMPGGGVVQHTDQGRFPPYERRDAALGAGPVLDNAGGRCSASHGGQRFR